MLNRRNIFNLGLWGSASALLSWPGRPRAQTGPATTPFVDPLPLPPAPGKVAPFSDLDPAAGQYRDPAAEHYIDPRKAAFYRIVAEVRSVQFHSQLPPTEIWGYRDGSLPASQPWDFALGPTFKRPLTNDAFSPTIVRHVNELPLAHEHVGFGEPRNSVHLHGGHQEARSDGYPTDFTQADGVPFKVTFEHGEHFDYAYPLLPPGSLDDKEFPPPTQTQTDLTERPSTLWYHDHILDFTSQNVYRGLAGFFLVHDDPKETDPNLLEHIRDTGDEKNRYGVPNALRLPSGDFDVPMVLHEKTFGRNGELIYDVFNIDGFLGEKFLVNGKVQPYLAVKRRKYRFRFLNGSNSRIYQIFLADTNGKTYPMTQIATEGGLLSRPVRRSSFLIAMAERVEVVIDFSQFKHPQFTELFIENRMIQLDGRGPQGKFEKPELAARGTQLLKFKLEEEVYDPSRVGIDRGNGLELRPFAPVSAAELSGAPIRNFVFERGNGQWQINGKLAGDLSRVVAQPVTGRPEIWRLINKSGGWWHPIHVHHEFMRVLKRNGKLPFDGTGPDFGQSVERDGLARKDTIALGPNSVVEVFVKFRDYRGPFVFHCHNMEHEDHAMMARFDVV
jgi:FtsP/CotA-like multicopper oxidase with cupredoxin domain